MADNKKLKNEYLEPSDAVRDAVIYKLSSDASTMFWKRVTRPIIVVVSLLGILGISFSSSIPSYFEGIVNAQAKLQVENKLKESQDVVDELKKTSISLLAEAARDSATLQKANEDTLVSFRKDSEKFSDELSKKNQEIDRAFARIEASVLVLQDKADDLKRIENVDIESLKTRIDKITTAFAAIENKEFVDLAADVSAIKNNLIKVTHTSGNGPNDGKDLGFVEGRKLSFTKQHHDTTVRIGYTDNLRVLGQNKACRWEILIDGKQCPSGELFYDRHDGNNANTHISQQVVGYCDALPKGPHEIAINVLAQPGRDHYRQSDCYTGWNNSRWVLEVMEINNQ